LQTARTMFGQASHTDTAQLLVVISSN